MKRDKGATPTPLDPEAEIHYGAPRDLEDQVSFALASVRVVTGFLGASRYGTCEDDQETEAAGLVLFRALEFLDELDFSKVTVKPETENET
jgi:hypothetical protein